MKSWQPQSEALQYMQKVWALAHALDVRSKRMARTIGVTGPQRLVLRLIGEMPDATAGTLARSLDLHASTLTGVLSRLEARRLITRRIDPEDRRRVRFSLTAAGKRIDRERSGTVEAAVRRALARVPDQKAAASEEVMAILVEELLRDR